MLDNIEYYLLQGSFKNKEACPDFDQILARFWSDFGQIFGQVFDEGFGQLFWSIENTVYSSTGTEKYSFTGSEDKGERKT